MKIENAYKFDSTERFIITKAILDYTDKILEKNGATTPDELRGKDKYFYNKCIDLYLELN